MLRLFFLLFYTSLLSAGEYSFERAEKEQRDDLVNFAIESNDIYNTRMVSRNVAEEVFAIPDKVFEKGVVEVLKVDGEILGFFTLKRHTPEEEGFPCELGHLFVKAGCQGRGLGTHLFERAIICAKEKGWDELKWVSDPDAEFFYRKMGAEVVDYFDNLLNPGVDLPVFCITLAL